jgi:endoglucanase
VAQYRRGVNLSGADFGEQNLPGIPGRDYTFNGDETYRYFADKGFNLFRIGVKWERLQPVPGGPLDAVYLEGLRRSLNSAGLVGAVAVVNLQNFARYRFNGLECIVDASPSVTREHLADLWVRVSKELREHPALYAFGLMNEPHDLGSDTDWKEISQSVLSALRDSGDRTLIMVAGYNWSHADEWPDIHGPDSWIDDPANNFAYEAHLYFDSDRSGQYALSYDDELRRNPRLASIGADRLRPFSDWLSRNRVRGYIGEYGIPGGDPRWREVFENFLQALDAASLDGTYWSAGEWWGDYALSVQPDAALQIEKPQLSVLARHI